MASALVLAILVSAILHPSQLTTLADESDDNRNALLCIKSGLSITTWNTTSPDFCSWPGVSCTRQPQLPLVVALDMEAQGFTGDIPPCISNLTSLVRIHMANNQLSGHVPQDLSRLTGLRYLNLSSNALSGEIPPSLSSCAGLEVLALSSNSIGGVIPPSLDSPNMWDEIARQMEFAKSTKGKFPNVSCKDAPVLPRYLIPNCCCGKPCAIMQSRHSATAGRAYYCCKDPREYCSCFFFQWIDGPEYFDNYLLSDDFLGSLVGPRSAETWYRYVRPPPSPPKLWKLDETTPKAPPLVWCEHCQDMTRWCPLYGADTLDESWKVFDEEMRQERLEWYNDWKKKDDEDYARRQKIEELVKETERKKEVEAKRKKEEEAKEREEKRRKQFDDSKTWLTKANTKWKLWKY